MGTTGNPIHREPWNKGKLVGQKAPFKLKDKQAGLKSEDCLFPSRLHDSPHLGTRQYARILGHWVDELGLDRAEYGTHSMRRTKATLISRRTKNLRAVQLLLGHSKLESTARYIGIEVDDALEISEQTEI
jgi:site-specific recombinase XerD